MKGVATLGQRFGVLLRESCGGPCLVAGQLRKKRKKRERSAEGEVVGGQLEPQIIKEPQVNKKGGDWGGDMVRSKR